MRRCLSSKTAGASKKSCGIAPGVCRPRGEVSCHRQMVTVANDLPTNGTNFSPPGRRYHTVQRLLMGHTGSSSSAASICTHRHP